MDICFTIKKNGTYSTRLFFNNFENEYVKKIEELFREKLEKKPRINRVKNVLVVRYYSKKLFKFIEDYSGWEISRNKRGYNKKSRTVFLKNKKFSKEFKKGFLRGFIDSDGYFSDEKIIFSSASRKIMEQTKQFLLDLNFEKISLNFYKEKRINRVGMWHLYLYKSERENFIENIRPRNKTSIKYAPAGIRISESEK